MPASRDWTSEPDRRSDVRRSNQPATEIADQWSRMAERYKVNCRSGRGSIGSRQKPVVREGVILLLTLPDGRASDTPATEGEHRNDTRQYSVSHRGHQACGVPERGLGVNQGSVLAISGNCVCGY